MTGRLKADGVSALAARIARTSAARAPDGVTAFGRNEQCGVGRLARDPDQRLVAKDWSARLGIKTRCDRLGAVQRLALTPCCLFQHNVNEEHDGDYDRHQDQRRREMAERDDAD